MNNRKRLTWEETALKLAFNIADYRSEDPYVQVGACILKHDGSFILGYNGAPSGIEIDWSNRDERRKRVLHSEANACNFVRPGESKLIAVTALPCEECLKTIKQKKINLVVYADELEGYNNEFAKQLAAEYKIELKKL